MTSSLVVAFLLAAQGTPQADPTAALARLIACRPLSSESERLSCFDREAAAVAGAREGRDLVVLSRQEAEAARAPRTRPAEFEPVSTTITAARRNVEGRWVFTLPDGSRWIQTDTRRLTRTPNVGSSIAIRSAALGSYLANVAGGIAIRVRPVD